MSSSVARPYHTLDHQHLAKSSSRKKCKCCPYGYHIDIDFVRYCESISTSQVLSDIPIRRSRWNVRKRRASKETLLGIAGLQQLEADSTKASQDVGDDLQKAVLDFEQVLNNSVGRSVTTSKCKDWQILKDLSGGEDHIKKSKKRVISSLQDEAKVSALFSQDDLDNVHSHGTHNASPQMLQYIRKQMAASLGRMRELEDEVKIIPNLQVHINNLEKENKKLNELLIEKENDVKRYQKDVNKLQDEVKVTRSPKLKDASTSTSQTHCHTRNIGVGSTVVTREIGISNTIRMTSCGTDPQNKQSDIVDKSVRPCLVSLENILGTSSKSPSKNVATSTDRLNKVIKDTGMETELRMKKILTEEEVTKRFLMWKKEWTEQMKKKNSCTVGSLTELRKDHIYTKEDLENNTKQIQLEQANAICNKPDTREINTQTIIATSDIGVCARVHMTDNWVHMVKKTRDFGVSNHTINDPCFNCSSKKINAWTQHDGDSKQVLKISNRTQHTDTSDLIRLKDQGVNTTKHKLVSTGVDVCSLYCAKCTQLQSDTTTTQQPTRPNRPSYLPVPLHALNKSKIQKPASSNTKKLRNEDYGSDSGSDDGGYNPQNEEIVSRLGSLSTFHPIQSKSYKKEPSKEMKGALKVLNDSLQKYSSENFPKHMRNAINIVQQEWFKISSVAEAIPLDVEDYLDCFEEISGTLLEYIVNMTDVTGNTAMHYAVSNGNFDVVSILLDSKVCNINKMNTAGYTCIMLVALSKVSSETDRQVVRRLFHMADVNIRAKQHGQTALMLAVSHGRIDTVELLLESGADINIQDEDGSTALMCAAEHGYIDIVKLLLTQADCDLTLTDYDGSTALAIAMDAGNRDIGVLLYAQEHFSRGGSPFTPSKVHRRAKSATPTLKGGTPAQSPLSEAPH